MAKEDPYVEFGAVTTQGVTAAAKFVIPRAELEQILTRDGEPKFFKIYKIWAKAGYFKSHKTVLRKTKKHPNGRRVKAKKSGMSECAMRALLAIGCFTDYRTGVCDEPISKLCDMFGLGGKSSLSDGVNELQRMGVISYTPGNRKRSPRYVFNIPTLISKETVRPGGPVKNIEKELVRPGGLNDCLGTPQRTQDSRLVRPGGPPLDRIDFKNTTTTTRGSRFDQSDFDPLETEEVGGSGDEKYLIMILERIERKFRKAAINASVNIDEIAVSFEQYCEREIVSQFKRCNEKTQLWSGLQYWLENYAKPRAKKGGPMADEIAAQRDACQLRARQAEAAAVATDEPVETVSRTPEQWLEHYENLPDGQQNSFIRSRIDSLRGRLGVK